MQKAEPRQANAQNQQTVRQARVRGVGSSQCEQIAQAVIDGSPHVGKMEGLAAMMHASPVMAAQRKLIGTIALSPGMVAQRMKLNSMFGAAHRAENEALPLQTGSVSGTPVQQQAKPNNTGLPDNLKSGIENLSGMAMDNVRVHYNSSQPAQLNALAYAQGTDIHVAPGQEQHLPHEAWHVVQQAQGRVSPTMQMKAVAVNDDAGLEAEADVMGERAFGMGVGDHQLVPQSAGAVSQLATPEEERQAWFTANQVYGNMPLDAGHFTGYLLKKAVLRSQYNDKVERKRADELAMEKAHLIEKNMYGRGKIGAVMRNIDTASRIMHLIGSISGLVALAANIAAFFAPAALPVGAIAGVIALAAHSAMAVLQTILIGRNLYRIRGLPEAEKAKILPTLYRDIAKLGFALLGVVTGGVGLGGAMQSGGLMAHHALEGAEMAVHGGHLAGDIAGETVGTYAMAGTILHQNEKENAIGMKGGLDHHAKHHATEPASDDLAAVMQTDLGESVVAVSGIDSASQDAIAGADGLAGDVRPLEELSNAGPKAQQALVTLQGSEASVDSMPETDKSALDAKIVHLDKVEEKMGITADADDQQHEQGDSKTSTVQQVAMGQTQDQVQAMAQRKGDEKPGLFSRAIGWFKRKFSSFKKRVKRVISGIRSKLTELVLKLAGIKNLPLEMKAALAEQRTEAHQVMGAVSEGRGALAEWKSAADQIGAHK